MRLEHTGKQLLFVFLSLADLTMTWALIGDGLGSVYESNPVAAWCLQGYGWAGMAVFKAGMVLASGGLSEVISRYRPRTGGRVLVLGCIITASVVLYSCYLYLTVPASESSDAMPIAQEQIEKVHRERVGIPFPNGQNGEVRTASMETFRTPVRNTAVDITEARYAPALDTYASNKVPHFGADRSLRLSQPLR
jgi:hypothetical protein